VITASSSVQEVLACVHTGGTRHTLPDKMVG